jgi:hypothetical protein
LPGGGRLLGRAHRGGTGGHRQGLPGDLAVPGGGTADRESVLRRIVAGQRSGSNKKSVMRKVGPLGESYFRVLCDRAGIVCNKAYQDETGWDFIIEYPHNRNLPLPIDMQPPPLTCLVQVKATDKKKRSISVKLSALHRLVQHNLPVFFVVFDFASEKEPKFAYVIHVDEKIIEETLKKIRTLEADDIKDINHHSLAIELSEKYRIERPDEKTLFTGIEKSIGRPFGDYGTWKQGLVRTVGFGEVVGGGKFSVTSNKTNPIAEMVDAMLGLKSRLEVSNFRLRSTRFGIEIDHPPIAEKGWISIAPNPAANCNIIFSNTSGESIEVHGSLYVPAIPGLEEQYRKVRILSDAIDFAFTIPEKENANFDFKIRLDHPCELASLESLFAIMGKKQVDVKIFTHDKLLFGATLDNLDSENEDYWKMARKCVAELRSLMRDNLTVFRIPPKAFLDVLLRLRNSLTPQNIKTATIGIQLKPGATLEGLLGQTMGSLNPMTVSSGIYHFIFFTLLSGNIRSISSAKIEIHCEQNSVLGASTIQGGSEDVEREIYSRLPTYEDRLKNRFKCYAMVPMPHEAEQ